MAASTMTKFFLRRKLDELDTRQQRACAADQAAAGFEDEFQTTCADQFLNRLGIRTKSGTVSS